MGKQIKLKNKHTIEELRAEIKKSNDDSQKTRLRAIIKLKENNTRTAIAKEFVIDRKTLLCWIKKYNEGGVINLIMSKGGRPEGNPKWNKNIFEDLCKEIAKNEKCWSIPLMQNWIKEKENKDIPETTVLYHVKKLNFTYKSLRPHPYLGDKEKQEKFKKKD